METFEPTSNWERREFFKPILERIFAQQIYAAVIRALVACQKDENGRPVLRFSREDINWLSRTFTRENIGAQEEAYVCMFPSYDYHKDSEEGKKEIWRKESISHLEEMKKEANLKRRVLHN